MAGQMEDDDSDVQIIECSTGPSPPGQPRAAPIKSDTRKKFLSLQGGQRKERKHSRGATMAIPLEYQQNFMKFAWNLHDSNKSPTARSEQTYDNATTPKHTCSNLHTSPVSDAHVVNLFPNGVNSTILHQPPFFRSKDHGAMWPGQPAVPVTTGVKKEKEHNVHQLMTVAAATRRERKKSGGRPPRHQTTNIITSRDLPPPVDTAGRGGLPQSVVCPGNLELLSQKIAWRANAVKEPQPFPSITPEEAKLSIPLPREAQTSLARPLPSYFSLQQMQAPSMHGDPPFHPSSQQSPNTGRKPGKMTLALTNRPFAALLPLHLCQLPPFMQQQLPLPTQLLLPGRQQSRMGYQTTTMQPAFPFALPTSLPTALPSSSFPFPTPPQSIPPIPAPHLSGYQWNNTQHFPMAPPLSLPHNLPSSYQSSSFTPFKSFLVSSPILKQSPPSTPQLQSTSRQSPIIPSNPLVTTTQPTTADATIPLPLPQHLVNGRTTNLQNLEAIDLSTFKLDKDLLNTLLIGGLERKNSDDSTLSEQSSDDDKERHLEQLLPEMLFIPAFAGVDFSNEKNGRVPVRLQHPSLYALDDASKLSPYQSNRAQSLSVPIPSLSQLQSLQSTVQVSLPSTSASFPSSSSHSSSLSRTQDLLQDHPIAPPSTTPQFLYIPSLSTTYRQGDKYFSIANMLNKHSSTSSSQISVDQSTTTSQTTPPVLTFSPPSSKLNGLFSETLMTTILAQETPEVRQLDVVAQPDRVAMEMPLLSPQRPSVIQSASSNEDNVFKIPDLPSKNVESAEKPPTLSQEQFPLQMTGKHIDPGDVDTRDESSYAIYPFSFYRVENKGYNPRLNLATENKFPYLVRIRGRPGADEDRLIRELKAQQEKARIQAMQKEATIRENVNVENEMRCSSKSFIGDSVKRPITDDEINFHEPLVKRARVEEELDVGNRHVLEVNGPLSDPVQALKTVTKPGSHIPQPNPYNIQSTSMDLPVPSSTLISNKYPSTPDSEVYSPELNDPISPVLAPSGFTWEQWQQLLIASGIQEQPPSQPVSVVESLFMNANVSSPSRTNLGPQLAHSAADVFERVITKSSDD